MMRKKKMFKLLLSFIFIASATSVVAENFKNTKIPHKSNILKAKPSYDQLKTVLKWLQQLRNKEGRLGFINELGKRRDGIDPTAIYSAYHYNTQDFREWTVDDLKKTKLIDLSGLIIDAKKLVHLSYLENLQELYLSNTLLENDDLLHVKAISSLRVLKLAFCKITDEGLRHLKSHHNLIKLDIRSRVLTNACIRDLMKLKNLEEVDLGTSKVNLLGAMQLQRALPNCVIKPFQYKLVKKLEGVLVPVRKKGFGQLWKIGDTFVVGLSATNKKLEGKAVVARGGFVFKDSYIQQGRKEAVYEVKSLTVLKINSIIDQSLAFNLVKNGVASSPGRWSLDGHATSDQGAIDGNSATYWDEEDGHKLYTFKVHLNKRKKITRITISGYNQHDFSPKDFDILVDGIVVKTIKNAQYENNFFETVFPTVDGKVVTLKITGYYGGSPAIREFGIYAQ